jgi:hypothetical protein
MIMSILLDYKGFFEVELQQTLTFIFYMIMRKFPMIMDEVMHLKGIHFNYLINNFKKIISIIQFC